MITAKQYKELFEKVGKTGKLTPQELIDLRGYECWLTDQKYNRTHGEDHIQTSQQEKATSDSTPQQK